MPLIDFHFNDLLGGWNHTTFIMSSNLTTAAKVKNKSFKLNIRKCVVNLRVLKCIFYLHRHRITPFNRNFENLRNASASTCGMWKWLDWIDMEGKVS